MNGDYMKHKILIALTLAAASISSSFALPVDQSPIDSCLNRVSLYSSATCQGVQTEEHANAVVACVNGVSPFASLKVCRGMKTATEAEAVVFCVNRISVYTMPTCAGVKAMPDAEAVISCVNSKSPFNARRFCGNAG